MLIFVVISAPFHLVSTEPSWHMRCRWWGHPPHQFKLSHGRGIDMDVGGDWLDLHCLPDGHRRRVPNAPAGHAAVADLAKDLDAVVCLEPTGGQVWQFWAALEVEGVTARQVPPAQVKAFAQSPGTRAKTHRIDAELIARFFAFRPETGRRLPAE